MNRYEFDMKNREKRKDVTIEEARELVRRYTEPVTETEFASIRAAGGRILAEDILAEYDSPPFSRSRMDGYAVRSAETRGASKETQREFPVAGETSAGHSFYGFAEAGQAVRIMTGAPVPEGLDCVVKQEDTELIFEKGTERGRYAQEGENVKISREMISGENISPVGSDFRKGQKILCSGEKIGFIEAGTIAGLGKMQVRVWKKPRAAVISTGDELVMPGTALTEGKIYCNNLFMLHTGAKDCGAEVVYFRQAGDSPEEIEECLREAAEAADFVVTTGGVSEGKKDYIPEALRLCDAEVIFDGMLIRPGMPTKFSLIGGTPVLSLTGAPSGASACFHLLGRLALSIIGRDPSVEREMETAVFRGTFSRKSPKARMMKGILHKGAVYSAETIHSGSYGPSLRAASSYGTGRDSADSVSAGGPGNNFGAEETASDSFILRGSPCYIIIPAGSEGLKDGDEVQVMRI